MGRGLKAVAALRGNTTHFDHLEAKACWVFEGNSLWAVIVSQSPDNLCVSLCNAWPLKIDSWKRRFLLETTIFRGDLLVSMRVNVSEMEFLFKHGSRQALKSASFFHCELTQQVSQKVYSPAGLESNFLRFYSLKHTTDTTPNQHVCFESIPFQI